jgi:hypothetical protein
MAITEDDQFRKNILYKVLKSYKGLASIKFEKETKVSTRSFERTHITKY